VITVAALCPAAPLLARELTGADPVAPGLRQACLDAASGLLHGNPDVVAVLGAGSQTRIWDERARLDLGIFAPALGAAAPGGTESLPVPLGLGARLLDQAGYIGRRVLQSVGEDEPASRCAELGMRIARSSERVALLAMADGSARRGSKAPGYLDERSIPFDAEVVRAVRAGDVAALLAVDPDLARDLMATGRPCWQVLAGSLDGVQLDSEIRYCGDPFGVAYLVAFLTPS
jgi:hypothetical protein